MLPQLRFATMITAFSWYFLLRGHGYSCADLGRSATIISIMSLNSNGYSEAFAMS